MIFSQVAEKRCLCCHSVNSSTSFSFVITYYIFQKQIKNQLAGHFMQSSQQATVLAQ